MTEVESWRTFLVRVAAARRLGPSFLRITFTGEDLDSFADNGYDQRIKLILPVPGHGLADLPTGPDWYPRWRALPDARRPPVRTYTVRAVRPADREVDVDLVLHASNGHGSGPAASWAAAARVGDEAALIGPNAHYQGWHGGVEFRPPEGVRTLLIAGDETAVPAVGAILDRLPADARGQVLLEVPHAADRLSLTAPDGVQVTWLAREGVPHGELLVPAVVGAVGTSLTDAVAANATDDGDAEPVWEVPEAAAPGESYAWLAGESGVIRTLRRHLVDACGWDRRRVAFMGYWRLGQPES